MCWRQPSFLMLWLNGRAAGEPAGEPLAHGVGLTGHRERTAAGPADIARQGHQVDQADHVVLAVDMLVVADPPEGQYAALARFSAP